MHVLGLLLTQPDFRAKRFFPLVPGNTWTYEDSATPGAQIVWTVQKEVVEAKVEDKAPGSETSTDYYPITITVDGINKGETDYAEKEDTCSHVGNGKNHPITPQPVLIVSRAGSDWDFYINAGPYSSEAVHFVAHSHLGPSQTIEGKLRDTVVVEMRVSFGTGKRSTDIHQTWKYASDIGLYEFSEVGHANETKLDHTQKLIKFEPGRSGTT